MNVKVRGRFYVEQDADGWTVVDSLTSGCLSFDTRREAEGTATFARQYVRKWGRIDFQSFPYSLDEEPHAGAECCPSCGGSVAPVAEDHFDGQFYEGHAYDCPRYGSALYI